MIYELRTYTLKPGMQPTVAKNAGTVGRDIRGDDYGKLEGYWLTEIGPLNQVMHLWSYESLDERARLRVELSKNEAWTSEYLPLIRPHLVRQDIRLMQAFRRLENPGTEGNVYEYRYYRARPGATGDFARNFEAGMAAREKHSLNVCAWITEAGQPNEVSHLWVYSSLNDRAEKRAAAAADPEWQASLKQLGPLLEVMSSAILLPAAHSPLK